MSLETHHKSHKIYIMSSRLIGFPNDFHNNLRFIPEKDGGGGSSLS